MSDVFCAVQLFHPNYYLAFKLLFKSYPEPDRVKAVGAASNGDFMKISSDLFLEHFCADIT